MSVEEHEAWLKERCPNEVGDDHWWGWVEVEGGRNIFWLHRCEGGRLMLGTIDVTKPIHTLVSEDPLHIEPSILCRACGDHGFIRDGRWQPA